MNAIAPHHWRRVFDITYSSPPAIWPARAGWNSRLTGQPFDASELIEWRDNFVDQVIEQAPGQVLEIGCGTGLIGRALAQHLDGYIGVDPSSKALAIFRSHADAAGAVLLQAYAHEIEAVGRGTFDTIILNSVAQYFPSAEYLRSVLRICIGLLSPRGRLMIGDVRNLHLEAREREECHATMSDRPPNEELLLSPFFFRKLAREARLMVEVRPKRGRFPNELNRFRYDVVMSNARTDAVTVVDRQGQAEPLLHDDLARALRFESSVVVMGPVHMESIAAVPGECHISSSTLTRVSDVIEFADTLRRPVACTVRSDDNAVFIVFGRCGDATGPALLLEENSRNDESNLPQGRSGVEASRELGSL